MIKIYQTFRNADTTEGRGPMVPEVAFLHKQDASDYIDDRPGIMGRRAKWSEEKYGADWCIRELEVHENLDEFPEVVERVKERKAAERQKEREGIEKQKLREGALNKLTPEEKVALGLDTEG